VNGHTVIIKSFGTTGVLLVLALVLLAIVSAIVAFDRWPESGSSSTVERIAVDRPEARRVETRLVAERRPTSLVRGVVAVRPSGTSATASGAGDVFLVADGGRGGQSDGGGFGPPPPPVPFDAPGEGGGTVRTLGNNAAASGTLPGGGPPPSENPIQRAACDARQALGPAGTPLDSACRAGDRGLVREAVAGAGSVPGAVRDAIRGATQLELTR
jgi:hypothetical protein